jgi:D-glycero-D-manno-heptose 1,7-bisphosphate phosphatase
MSLKRAVFIDRDGTINEESGYLFRKEDCRFIPGTIEAIGQLTTAGFLVVVITNQSGIARGYYSATDLEQLHLYMAGEIAAGGGRVDGWYHCPHHPDYPAENSQCDCRKPLPGMLQLAAHEMGIDLASSWMIGDKIADVDAGGAAGCRTILVKTGYGAVEAQSAPAEQVILADLGAAAAHIIAQTSKG